MLFVEHVGSVPEGLQAMCWSPDLELAALVTSQPALLLITAEFEPVAELPLFSEEFGDMAPVTVGWGRKETQFHGSAGKAAAVASEPTAEPAGRDDGRPRVTWRGDGQMLAVSVLCRETGARRFVVVSRDGSRLSTSEPVAALGQSLAWRPSGATLAATQRLPNKLQVVFFEKNGLRHGEFTLPFPPDAAHVRELLWSPDSAVLAVWLELGSESESESRVQLWTTGNYHWYCKQEHVVAAGDRAVAVTWHPAADYRLLVLCRSGRLLTWEHQWRWSTAPQSSVAAVADGTRLLITPLASTVVPPPMSAHELVLSASVSAVCQGPAGADHWLWAVTSDRRLHAFRLLPLGAEPVTSPGGCTVTMTAGGGVGFAARAPLHEWRGSCSVGGAPPVYAAWAWELVSAERMVCAAHTQDGYQLWLMDVSAPETAGDGGVSVTLSRTVPVSCAPLITSAVGGGSADAVVHSEEGSMALLDTETAELRPLTDSQSGTEVRLPVPAQQVVAVSGGPAGRRRVLSLTGQRRLYCDGRPLLSACSSFGVSDDFLVVTTLEHTLLCLPLTALLADGSSVSESSWSEVGTRRLERGSRLVTAVRGDTRLVLQMPRGNLEVIHPRPLVVARLARLMDSAEYYTAYSEMRRHRINLNLLVDHDPETFAARCDDICAALRHEPSWLCVFVSDLSEEDVTRTLYRESYRSRSAAAAPPGKVDRVCELVRDSLERLDRGRLLLPLLTTLVRHTRPRLEEALRVISQLRDTPPTEPGAVTADAALRYLICLVDVDQLYSVAMGTYDFDLVLMVAEKSQKDPKEYLPLLNELRQLPAEYARYRVDCLLRRHESALRHLAAAGADRQPELLRLVQERGLYSAALRLLPAGGAAYRAVCGLFAEHLDGAGRCWEAAALYVRAGAQTSAVDALRRAGAWRQCLQTAGQLGMPADQLRQLAAGLAAELRTAGRCADAAEVYERHLRQPEDQVACLLEGRLWDQAVAACHQARRPQMVAVLVVPALHRAAANMADTLRRISDTLTERRARLAVVRAQQLQLLSRQRCQLADGEGPAGADSDLYSDSSSVSGVSASSGSSGRTFRSSKSRRKQERKKYSLREGSGLEDLALVAACHALITEASALTEEMSALLRALVQHSLDEPAGGLQCSFAALLDTLPAAAAEVWPEPAAVAQPPPAGLGPTVTANQLADLAQAGGDAVAAQTAYAARMAQLEPHLRFPPLLKKDDSWKLLCLEGFGAEPTS
ncbi:elongator complex protein 1-like [Amphibalanus amphitrite]|uniref:elongator complex protein 1-like n=1 Tax=Amphibalanus amphitrite TaxID=1232801 RepID=UPI001C926889|nr:elongator complex protein 1-like [Amphibalanus amphitrite]